MRDALGNVMAMYDNAHSTINWKEQHLYGSSRLGMLKPNADLAYDTRSVFDTVGKTYFELTNHLGNVMSVISDKRVQYTNDGTTLTGYLADVVSAGDSYAFGMSQPGRDYNVGTYRYGLNGQEKDGEIDPNGDIYTAEFWEYDSRIGRRWNIDPVIKPWESSYAAFSENPIVIADPNGDDGKNPDCEGCKGRVLATVQVHATRRGRARRDGIPIPKIPNRFIPEPRYYFPVAVLRQAHLNGWYYQDRQKDPVNQLYYHIFDDPYVFLSGLFNPWWDHTHLGGRLAVGEDQTNAFVGTAPLILGGETKLFDTSINSFAIHTGTLDGSFSVSNWEGYPAAGGGFKPAGPFRLLEGTEYNQARAAANRANATLRASYPELFKGFEIHEIQPVKFGGSPTALSNKILLTPQEHRLYNAFWKTMQTGAQ